MPHFIPTLMSFQPFTDVEDRRSLCPLLVTNGYTQEVFIEQKCKVEPPQGLL